MVDNYIHGYEYNYSVHEYHYRCPPPRPCYHFTSVNEVLGNHRNLAGPVLVGFTPKLGQCKQGTTHWSTAQLVNHKCPGVYAKVMGIS